MFCDVTLIRVQGVAVPRWQLGSLQPVRGHLVVRDEVMADLGRTTRRASLSDVPEFPRLYDVVLLGTAGDWLTLGGFERVDIGGRWADFAQTWLVRPLGPGAPA